MELEKANRVSNLVSMRNYLEDLEKDCWADIHEKCDIMDARTTVRVFVRWLPQIITLIEEDIAAIDKLIQEL